MANLRYDAKDIKGLLPALDVRTVEQPFVASGKNFVFDIKGPKSGFAARLATIENFRNSHTVASFQVDGETFFACQSGILRYNETGDYLYPAYVIDGLAQTGPWSHTKVGQSHYFCCLGAGVLQYTPSTNTWMQLTTFVPADPQAVITAYGRLIILGSDRVSWSALDTGSDLTPSRVTGAGFQLLSIVPGQAVALAGIPAGFVAYTTEGTLRATFNDAASVFTFRVVSEGAKRPINTYCMVKISDTQHVLLDRTGFFASNGTTFEPWQPLFSEFVATTLLRQVRTLTSRRLRMYFNADRQLFFLSVADYDNSEYSNKAYVLYVPKDAWGSFDERHSGFLELQKTTGPWAGLNFGYVDDLGTFRAFDGVVGVEQIPTNAYAHQPLQQQTARTVNACAYFTSQLQLHTEEAKFINRSLPSNWYSIAETNLAHVGADASTVAPNTTAVYRDFMFETGSEDWMLLSASEDWNVGESSYIFKSEVAAQSGLTYFAVLSIPTNWRALNSEISIGNFRMFADNFPDQVTQFTDLMLGVQGNAEASVFEDWLTMPDITIDLLTSTLPDLDFGDSVVDSMQYSLSFSVTNDGRTIFNTVSPTLAVDTGDSRYYSLFAVGVFGLVNVQANQFGQSYHLRDLELSATPGGRLI